MAYSKTLIYVTLMMAYVVAVCLCDPTCQQMNLNSNNYAYRRQSVPNAAEVTSITLITQRSNSACVQGATFGAYGTDVWVNRGCRGSFNVCYIPGAKTTVSCSSRNYRPQRCYIGHPAQSVSLKRHLSNSPCVWNFSFEVDGNYLVVSNGCRAVFNVGYLTGH